MELGGVGNRVGGEEGPDGRHDLFFSPPFWFFYPVGGVGPVRIGNHEGVFDGNNVAERAGCHELGEVLVPDRSPRSPLAMEGLGKDGVHTDKGLHLEMAEGGNLDGGQGPQRIGVQGQDDAGGGQGRSALYNHGSVSDRRHGRVQSKVAPESHKVGGHPLHNRLEPLDAHHKGGLGPEFGLETLNRQIGSQCVEFGPIGEEGGEGADRRGSMDPCQQLVERVSPERVGAEAREGLDPGRNQRIKQTVYNPMVGDLILTIRDGDRMEAVVTDQVEDLVVRRGQTAGPDFPPLSGCIHAPPDRPILFQNTDTGPCVFAERFETDSKTGDAAADDNHIIVHSLLVPLYKK